MDHLITHIGGIIGISAGLMLLQKDQGAGWIFLLGGMFALYTLIKEKRELLLEHRIHKLKFETNENKPKETRRNHSDGGFY